MIDVHVLLLFVLLCFFFLFFFSVCVHSSNDILFFIRRRERHAKTIDIAQEEVLTCLGIHLYERLHRIWQKLRAEEQTWQILFHLGIDALRKSFEVYNLSLCVCAWRNSKMIIRWRVW